MKLSVLGMALALTAIMAVFGAVPVGHSDSGSKTYQFLVGTGLLCELAPSACPDISMASNGDTVAITGSGSFSLRPFTASGSGTFVHKDSSGNVKGAGTWMVTKFIAFHSFGDATPQGLPSNLEGGQLVLQVRAFVGETPVATAILNVDCELGKPPPGQGEGVALSVQDIINFNKKVSGFTVFIRT